jgi:hypothetical protein
VQLILALKMEEWDVTLAEEAPGAVELVVGEGGYGGDASTRWIETRRDAKRRRVDVEAGVQEGGRECSQDRGPGDAPCETSGIPGVADHDAGPFVL